MGSTTQKNKKKEEEEGISPIKKWAYICLHILYFILLDWNQVQYLKYRIWCNRYEWLRFKVEFSTLNLNHWIKMCEKFKK